MIFLHSPIDGKLPRYDLLIFLSTNFFEFLGCCSYGHSVLLSKAFMYSILNLKIYCTGVSLPYELIIIVKIGVNFMSFSNPTCHFRDTADFTVCTVCTLGKVSCSSEMTSWIWKWHEIDTYFHHHFYLKNADFRSIT